MNISCIISQPRLKKTLNMVMFWKRPCHRVCVWHCVSGIRAWENRTTGFEELRVVVWFLLGWIFFVGESWSEGKGQPAGHIHWLDDSSLGEEGGERDRGTRGGTGVSSFCGPSSLWTGLSTGQLRIWDGHFLKKYLYWNTCIRSAHMTLTCVSCASPWVLVQL